MVVEIKSTIVDGHLLKWMVAAGASWLEQHKDHVNNSNVFPVPDGDTGTNMLLTIRKAYQQIANVDDAHIGTMSEKIARGALTGARGNSGTILSMLLRGFAQSLKDKDVMDAKSFAIACQGAVDYAYATVRSVMEPVEGTILTVAREAAESIQNRPEMETNLRVLLEELINAAHKSLENTPNLLPKLKEAGVVDSGGMGLVYILEGMKRLIDGLPVTGLGVDDTNVAVQENLTWQNALVPEDEEGYGYDVQFLMLGENLDVNQVRQDISAMGWSPLIDGDDRLIKVHIHVHNPGEPLNYAISMGVELDDIVVENMQAQYLQYVQDRSAREIAETQPVEGVAVITVARGDGLQKVFEEYGADRVILGGQTMNPSTEDFLSAIESVHTNEIILLPNNGNVIMAAQQAASISHEKDVRVVPSKTIQQGIAALIAHIDHQDGNIDTIFEAMSEALQSIISAEVTYAIRDAIIDGVSVREGNAIGLINGKLVVSGDDLSDVILQTLKRAHAEDREIITLYYGEGVTRNDAESLVNLLSETFELDYEIVHGGQPLYPYLISVE